MATRTKKGDGGGVPTNGVTPSDRPAGTVVIQAPKVQWIKVPIVGMTPLITHAWSEKAKNQMRDAQMKKAKGPREAKNPEEEYQAAFYVADDGWYGVPAAGFKAACVGACRFVEGLPMTHARRLLFIEGDGRSTRQNNVELVRIEGKPHRREDFVRLDNGSADIRYRPEFPQWSAVLTVRFDAQVISQDQVVNLIERAGYSEGVCEWRPSSPNADTGTFGTWRVKRQ